MPRRFDMEVNENPRGDYVAFDTYEADITEKDEEIQTLKKEIVDLKEELSAAQDTIEVLSKEEE